MDHDGDGLAQLTADRLREMLISGLVAPGQKLVETQMTQSLAVSRNTLREAFRMLARDGLLRHIPNRGVYAVAPDESTIVDIYRVRRVIQRGAVESAVPGHPALSRMAALVAEAAATRDAGDWQRVGTLNMAFHRAMVGLTDSRRLQTWFDNAMAQMRMVFRQMQDEPHLYEPFVELNERLNALIADGARTEAAAELDAYLLRSERAVLAGFARRQTRR